MPKKIILNDEARSAIKGGLDKLASTVKTTLGPMGRNVSIDRGFGAPINTKDGVTVAKECIFEDPFMNHGARIIKEAASKTNDLVGDGTSTSTVLAQAVVNKGLKQMSAGFNPVLLKQGIEECAKLISDNLDKMSVEVKDEDIAKVASISANDNKIGKVISDVILKVGRGNPITIEDGNEIGLTTEVVTGMRWQNGYFLPHFITSEKMVAEAKTPYILVTDQKINFETQIGPIAEKIVNSGKHSTLMIVADEFDGSAVQFMVKHHIQGNFKFLPVKAPYFGNIRTEMLKDIAAATGAKIISQDAGMKIEEVELDDLGRADKAVSTSDSTTIVGGHGDKKEIESRILSATSITQDKGSSKHDKEVANERIGKLKSGIGVIKVGAATESELQEIKYRVEDAMNASTVAVRGGIVPGGGVALIRAAQAIDIDSVDDNIKDGVKLVIDAITEPLKQIVRNAGGNAESVYEKVLSKKGSIGYNAVTDTIEDMFEAGIVDPLEVTKAALTTACSVGALFLMTEAVIVEVPENARIDIPDKLLDV